MMRNQVLALMYLLAICSTGCCGDGTEPEVAAYKETTPEIKAQQNAYEAHAVEQSPNAQK